ncbi:hypothetical protein [Streptomyces sp. NBC_00233]|uniref:hypothetical protein n=1 Tax=Streptomyces sp. NBC_00233 TaxID=2975686 RepID=UPI0022532FDE|nr:hypothetical protein [Streptomyces sp. NBC_00233]MCX5228520.1 hypothetical protein [Streptomyces sp. NBC_00233]
MASHRKLRAAAVVCAIAVVAGPAPVAAWAAAGPAAARPGAVSAAPSPSPDPFADLTADEIADRAVTATRSATSLRMTGRVVTEGQPLDIDFAVNDHDECTGVMKIKGGTAELRKIDRITYMKGDEAFWRVSMASQGMPEAQIDATVELVKGRWLKITPGQAGSADLSGVCDLKSLLADLDKDKEERRGLTRGPDAEVDGTPVATLVKKKAEGETTTVSVSQEGKPYILKMVKAGGEEPGAMVLSDYDKPVRVVVPPADETVDLSKLDGGTPA